MNRCLGYSLVIKHICTSGGGDSSDAIWQDIVDTCTSNRGKTYTDSYTIFGAPDSYKSLSKVGIVSSNGCIYYLPAGGNSKATNPSPVRKLDVSTGSIDSFGEAIDKMYYGGALASNGYIYGIPYNATSILKIDPTTDTYTTFGELSISDVMWNGGVLAPNGCIYGMPYSATSILKIDTSTDTVTTFGDLSSTNYKWWGGVLAPNGCIYGIPYNATSILKIDPTTDTYTTFGEFSGSTAMWCGGVLAPNGYIYGMPFNSTSILKIDPTTDTYTTFGDLSDIGNFDYGGLGNRYSGGVLAPNGYIYGIPAKAQCILKIDPVTDTYTTIGDFSTGGAKWYGGILATDGCIYCAPWTATSGGYLKIDPGSDVNTNFQTNTLLSPYLNKY